LRENKMSDCPPEHKLCTLADLRFRALDEKWNIKHESLRDEIKKSENLLTIKLDGMNHVQKQINEERMNFATRRETILLNFIISIAIVFVGAIITWAVTH
jgi:hypothetical protein